MNFNIKKIVRRIYEFNFTNCDVKNRAEFYTTNGVSEFVSTFKKNDFENGIIVSPSGYKAGIFFSTNNGGEIYCPTKYNPDIVKFNFNIYGLKKGSYYRVTIPARSAGTLDIITKDRSINLVTDTEELVINEDLTNIDENKELCGIFRAQSNEINLFFTFGKVIVSNIIIDEVEILTETDVEEATQSVVFEEGKLELASYGVFNLKANEPEGYLGRYSAVTKYTGTGINLYYDKTNNEYILERDNVNDVLNESFNLLNYIVELNVNKTVNKNIYANYRICEVSLEPSPNTLKQGYIKFDFVDFNGNKVLLNEGRISILIYKLY